MRRLSEISDELVSLGERWWGELYWTKGDVEAIRAPNGFEVRRFGDPALLKGYSNLLEDAFAWGHSDPLAWHVLIIDSAYEVGEDFVMLMRHPGTQIRNFYPEHTDDPVEPPTEQLAKLHETIARMRDEAATPRDQFLAELVAKRLAALDHHLVFDWGDDENRFHLWDLDPDPGELGTWMSVPSNLD
jgi:hypothetical protein